MSSSPVQLQIRHEDCELTVRIEKGKEYEVLRENPSRTKSGKRLSEYSKQIVLQWILGHCGVTGNEFADHLAKKGASIQQIARKAVPFTSTKRIMKKKLNDLSLRQYSERNSNKIWWNNFKDLPM
ncbi:hypothetical protein TNCV_2376551 [Trichonephila clavipes]|nr:hypothetical protein TNCV_2376551 [Trichonephila clavipes]